MRRGAGSRALLVLVAAGALALAGGAPVRAVDEPTPPASAEPSVAPDPTPTPVPTPTPTPAPVVVELSSADRALVHGLAAELAVIGIVVVFVLGALTIAVGYRP